MIYGHGLTNIEAKIMELYDSGRSAEMIAGAMDIGIKRVRAVISNYRVTGREESAFNDMARRGTIALAAAIARARA